MIIVYIGIVVMVSCLAFIAGFFVGVISVIRDMSKS